jgi:hypothetical protein
MESGGSNNNLDGSVLRSVCDWLFELGYDGHLQWSHHANIEEAIATQTNDRSNTLTLHHLYAFLTHTCCHQPSLMCVIVVCMSRLAVPIVLMDVDYVLVCDVCRWPSWSDDSLMSLLHQIGDRCGESSLLTLTPTQLRLKSDDLSSYPSLQALYPALSLASLRLRFCYLRKFNQLFSSLLPLIDLRRTDDLTSIAGAVKLCKTFIFSGVKVKHTCNHPHAPCRFRYLLGMLCLRA